MEVTFQFVFLTQEANDKTSRETSNIKGRNKQKNTTTETKMLYRYIYVKNTEKYHLSIWPNTIYPHNYIQNKFLVISNKHSNCWLHIAPFNIVQHRIQQAAQHLKPQQQMMNNMKERRRRRKKKQKPQKSKTKINIIIMCLNNTIILFVFFSVFFVFIFFFSFLLSSFIPYTTQHYTPLYNSAS